MARSFLEPLSGFFCDLLGAQAVVAAEWAVGESKGRDWI